MRDAKRDELEMKISRALEEGATLDMIIETLNEALSYVQNNPSVVDIELAAEEVEANLHSDAEFSLFEGGAGYCDACTTLDEYRAAILIMEKHA